MTLDFIQSTFVNYVSYGFAFGTMVFGIFTIGVYVFCMLLDLIQNKNS